jgi:hypothetical protein
MKILALIFTVLYLISASTQASLDLASWDELLAESVSDGVVDYTQWRDNPRFDELVAQVGTADTASMDQAESLAFYINAYNILAARGILDNSSPSSLLGRYSYFMRDKYNVAGEEMNLYDLENELIRPLGEPRIHFAIVCASQSCPVLRSEAYSHERLDTQLNEAARDFINDTRRNSFDISTGKAKISKIFDWFEEDFEASADSLQLYLADYVNDADTAAILRNEGFKIKHMKYDWELNGTK